MKKLEQYNFPEELKTMSDDELDLLSYSIRDFLLEKVSKTGGHLASNLGVVELTIAIHKVYDSPRDKIVWDVGHQSYVHKILTGRAGDFDTLRQLDGMSGFPKTKESMHDCFDTGHSSTSISVAAGLAAARDIKGDDYHVVAVIGDGALTGGLAFEGLNNLGASKSSVTVILNDNGMSISKNIGGLSQHLSKLRMSDGYLNAKKTVKDRLNKIPVIGGEIAGNISEAKERIKYAIFSEGVIFEELGFTYLGPVDGHNIKALTEIISLSEKIEGPVLIHVITKKGKGYRNAEIDPNKFHGIGPFDPETGKPLKTGGITYSDILGKTAVRLAVRNPEITAVSAAMCDATGLGEFADRFPQRFFDVGIEEAHAVTFAAGMAKGGMKPLVAIYSSFLQRAFDQILEDVCLQQLPVVFAVDRAGIVGADGETHHGIFDLSYLSLMPGMTVLTPKDGNQLEAMLEYAFTLNGPVAIRYPRGKCEFDASVNSKYDGGNIRISEGRDADILAVGNMTETAVAAAEILRQNGHDVGVVDIAEVKPISDEMLSNDGKLIVTLEDNVIAGGFGENLVEIIGSSDMLILGWPDQFIEHGDTGALYERYGLDPVSVAERISEKLEGKA